MKLKTLLFALLFLACFSTLASAQQFTYPYVLTFPQLTCSPSGCYSNIIIGYGGYGSVYVFGQGACSSGVRPYVTPQQQGYYCTLGSMTQLYAYAVVAQSSQLYYVNGQQVWAQQLEGLNGTYSYQYGNWISLYSGYQFNDCFSGNLRLYEPTPRPC